jgi:hypothetical protein
VRYHCTGAKRLRHPVAGDLTLAYEAIELHVRMSASTADQQETGSAGRRS